MQITYAVDNLHSRVGGTRKGYRVVNMLGWSKFVPVLSNQGFQRDGTVKLFGTAGQAKLFCPGTKGQRDKLKILPRDGTGRDFLRLSRPVPGRPAGQNYHLFCTFMPFSEKNFKKKKNSKKIFFGQFLANFWPIFGHFWPFLGQK